MVRFPLTTNGSLAGHDRRNRYGDSYQGLAARVLFSSQEFSLTPSHLWQCLEQLQIGSMNTKQDSNSQSGGTPAPHPVPI